MINPENLISTCPAYGPHATRLHYINDIVSIMTKAESAQGEVTSTTDLCFLSQFLWYLVTCKRLRCPVGHDEDIKQTSKWMNKSIIFFYSNKGLHHSIKFTGTHLCRWREVLWESFPSEQGNDSTGSDPDIWQKDVLFHFNICLGRVLIKQQNLKQRGKIKSYVRNIGEVRLRLK